MSAAGGTLLEAGPFHAVGDSGRVLLDDVSVRLAAGALAVVAGPSGAGKSTLLRALCGLSPAAECRRRLAESEFADTRLPEWRAQVTLLAQDAPMLAGSVEENLSFPFGSRAGRDRSFDREAAHRLLAEVGLVDLAWQREVRTLSGGERHRLALVRGLLWDPPVLVADEPLSGLDAATAERCFARLAAFARRDGHAALVVLHDPALAELADRVLRLEAGRLEVAA